MQERDRLAETIRALYGEKSKHAGYQTLPEFLAGSLDLQFSVNEEWRGDRPRYPVIRQMIGQWRPETLLDVGANTGFFSFSLAHDFPTLQVLACEPNPRHGEIIRLLAEFAPRLNVRCSTRMVDRAGLLEFPPQDCILHLNILHHAGHDFDRELVPDRAAFPAYARAYLRQLAQRAPHLIFQMGYHWGGNKEEPLVGRHEQGRKIGFTLELFRDAGWQLEALALARPGTGTGNVEYELLEPDVLPATEEKRQCYLTERYGERVWSEFYQRPIWFCRRA